MHGRYTQHGHLLAQSVARKHRSKVDLVRVRVRVRVRDRVRVRVRVGVKVRARVRVRVRVGVRRQVLEARSTLLCSPHPFHVVTSLVRVRVRLGSG